MAFFFENGPSGSQEAKENSPRGQVVDEEIGDDKVCRRARRGEFRLRFGKLSTSRSDVQR